jgi:hypothetical protein
MLRTSFLLATAAAVSQRSDWLVHTQDAKTRLLKTTNGLKLTNGLVARTFATQTNGYFCTTDLRRGDRSFFRALSPEANVTLNGQRFNVGGCLGNQWTTTSSGTPSAGRSLQIRPPSSTGTTR